MIKLEGFLLLVVSVFILIWLIFGPLLVSMYENNGYYLCIYILHIYIVNTVFTEVD